MYAQSVAFYDSLKELILEGPLVIIFRGIVVAGAFRGTDVTRLQQGRTLEGMAHTI